MQISRCLNKIVRLYARNGFVMNVVMMDMEFDKVSENIDNIEVNTTADREHVKKLSGAYVLLNRGHNESCQHYL